MTKSGLQANPRPQLICYLAGSRITPLLAFSPRQLRVLKDGDGGVISRFPVEAFVPSDAGLSQHRVVFVGREARRARFNFYAEDNAFSIGSIEPLRWVLEAFQAIATTGFADRPETLTLVLWHGVPPGLAEKLRATELPDWIGDVPLDNFSVVDKATLLQGVRAEHRDGELVRKRFLFIEDEAVTYSDTFSQFSAQGLDALKARALEELGLQVNDVEHRRSVWRELERAARDPAEAGIGRLDVGQHEVAVTPSALRTVIRNLGIHLLGGIRTDCTSNSLDEIFVDETSESLIFEGLREACVRTLPSVPCRDLWKMMSACAQYHVSRGEPCAASDVDLLKPRVQRLRDTSTTEALKQRAESQS